nr:MAG: protease polymerase P70 [Chemarfal virus 51]
MLRSNFPQLATDKAMSLWMSEVRNGERRIDPDSSPGNPWCKIAPTNGEVFEFDELAGYTGGNIQLLRESVIDRMLALHENPLMDDIHLFIKPEPHNAEKVEKHKWRLISGVGLTDQIVVRLLTEELVTDINEHPLVDGLAAGWSPFTEGGFTAILNTVGRGPIQCADRSSWDWSCQEFLILMLGEVMVWLCDDMPKHFQKVLINHVIAIAGKKTFENNGHKTTHGPGVMLSGWYWTLLGNSIMQILAQELTNVKRGEETENHLSMGDDTVGKPLSAEFLETMQNCTGMIIKEVHTYHDEFEFCGMHFQHSSRKRSIGQFRKASFHPVYVGKHAHQLSHMTVEEAIELLPSYQWLYMFDAERLQAIHRWMRAVGAADRIVSPTVMQRKVIGLPYRTILPTHSL